MESNLFSWERVWALLVRYWAEQRGKLFAVMMAAAAMMVFGFSTAGKYNMATPVFFNLLAVVSKIGFSICMFYHVHLGFTVLKDRKSASFFLLMPATNREKFILLILSSIVIPAIFYVFLFVFFAILFQALFYIEYVTFLEYILFLFRRADVGIWKQFLTLYSCLSALILGQFIFEKNATVKTFFILLFGGGFLTGLEQAFLSLIFRPTDFYFTTDLLGGLYQKMKYNLSPIDNGLFGSHPVWFSCAVSCMITMLGYVCYLKFKEREAKI